MNPRHSKQGSASTLKTIFLLLLSVATGSALLIATVNAVLGACGNGLVDKFEQCDDGNLNNGDGCSSICQKEGDDFPVVVYTVNDPPPTPALQDLPLLTEITQHGITWTFAEPQRVGRFVNGDYYVVGTATITEIQPLPTMTNGLDGSMLNIQPNIQRSGFDSRIESGRYDPSLRVYPPSRWPLETNWYHPAAL